MRPIADESFIRRGAVRGSATALPGGRAWHAWCT